MMSGNRWDADDLAQETFLEAMRSWRRLADRSRTGTWLYAILLAQHRRRLRGRQRSWRRWLGWFARRERQAEEPADMPAIRREWGGTLWASVAELPESQRDAIVLRYSEQLSYEEIAEVMSCPVGTVRSRLFQARAALERKLGAPMTGKQPVESHAAVTALRER